VKKSAFAAVTGTIDRENVPVPSPGHQEESPSSYPKHRQGKKAVISYHSKALSKALKQIALDNDKTLQEVTEEAYVLVLQRYGVKVSGQDL
jgi:hypothetical protein